MSVSDWQRQQLRDMAAMMQRLGLDLRAGTPCHRAPAAAIDLCRPCAARNNCEGLLAPEHLAPEKMPSYCPKVERLTDLMAGLEFVAPHVTRH